MKKKLLLFLTTMILSTSLAFSACGEEAKEPDTPDTPNTPVPEEPNTPNTPSTPTTPEEPSTPDTPSTPTTPDQPSTPDTPTTPDTPSTPTTPDEPSTPDTPTTPEEPDTNTSYRTLIVYFSAQNHTEAVAGYIAEATHGELFELVPVKPYTSDDLDWTDSNSRVSKEHADKSLQTIELTSTTVEGWENYDTVFIGYPIWWGEASWVVNGFVTANDFTGKTVIPFCTSSSSPLGQSGTNLAQMAGTGNWLEGKRFQSSASETSVKEWVESLDIDFEEKKPETPDQDSDKDATATLTFERGDGGYIVTGETEEASIIVIPSTHEGEPVVGIGESAFAYSKHTAKILSVTIPDSVIEIGKNAFHNQDALEQVNLGENSGLKSIGSTAFSGCSSLKSFYLPAGCVSIGYDVSAPSFATEDSDFIDSYGEVFNSCGALEEFTVGEGNPVFESMGGHLVCIGGEHNKTGEKILVRGVNVSEIPSGVTEIGKAAFRGATVSALYIPESVTKIENYFADNSAITTIFYAGSSEDWNGVEKSRMWNYNGELTVTYDTASPVAADNQAA